MEISLTEFKTLLFALKEKNVGLKVRTHTGWSAEFLHIIGFIASTREQERKTFSGVVLSNMNETEGILINNISSISAFELQQACDPCIASTVYHLSDNMSLKALILK